MIFWDPCWWQRMTVPAGTGTQSLMAGVLWLSLRTVTVCSRWNGQQRHAGSHCFTASSCTDRAWKELQESKDLIPLDQLGDSGQITQCLSEGGLSPLPLVSAMMSSPWSLCAVLTQHSWSGLFHGSCLLHCQFHEGRILSASSAQQCRYSVNWKYWYLLFTDSQYLFGQLVSKIFVKTGDRRWWWPLSGRWESSREVITVTTEVITNPHPQKW
jgi:hypothetical protein